MVDNKKPFDPKDSNPDPLTGEPGAHPVGTGIGAAGAGAVGAAVGGAVGGPVGAAIGGIVGAVAGGLVGKNAAEQINPTVEEEYWRDNYTSRPYAEKGRKYEDYEPAYRTGYEGYSRHAGTGRTYTEVEPELRSDYERNRGGAGLAWEQAKHATRDAWERVENTFTDKDRRTAEGTTPGIASDRDATVRLHEERLVADKHREKAGEVGVGKHVETETARASVPVESERVVVERNNPVDAGKAVAPSDAQFGGEAVRMELYEEVPDIHKEAYVRENVDVKKVVDREMVDVEEQLRREELDVDAPGNPVIDRRDDRGKRDRRDRI